MFVWKERIHILQKNRSTMICKKELTGTTICKKIPKHNLKKGCLERHLANFAKHDPRHKIFHIKNLQHGIKIFFDKVSSEAGLKMSVKGRVFPAPGGGGGVNLCC